MSRKKTDEKVDREISFGEEASEVDPLTGSQASVWRSWAEKARPELLAEFNDEQLVCLQEVRRRYPAECRPGSADYRNLKNESIRALNLLAEGIQASYDEFHPDAQEPPQEDPDA